MTRRCVLPPLVLTPYLTFYQMLTILNILVCDLPLAPDEVPHDHRKPRLHAELPQKAIVTHPVSEHMTNPGIPLRTYVMGRREANRSAQVIIPCKPSFGKDEPLRSVPLLQIALHALIVYLEGLIHPSIVDGYSPQVGHRGEEVDLAAGKGLGA